MISIIIPVYNVEDYLRECLDSIVNQSFADWEAILVDDGSTDGSLAICHEYAQSNSHIQVFHKENGGVSTARNLGIEKASGEWIWFVDADDWIEKDALQKLDNIISRYDCDTIFHGLIRVNEKGMVNKLMADKDIDSPKKVFLENHFCFQNGMLLFNAHIIRSIALRYTEGIKMGEDLVFQYKYLIHCKKPISIGCNLYYYRYREGSAVSNSQSLINNMKNNFQNAFELLKYIQMWHVTVDTWLCKRIQLLMKAAIQSASTIGADKRKYAQSELASIKQYMKENHIPGVFDTTLQIASLDINLYASLLKLYLKLKS